MAERCINKGVVNGGRLADRLGMTVHQSLLERRLRRLMRTYPSDPSESPETWLMDVAHARGARVVQRPEGNIAGFLAPSADVVLVMQICC